MGVQQTSRINVCACRSHVRMSLALGVCVCVCWGVARQHPALPTLSPAYPACPVHWLIIQPRADHVEGGHDSNHSYAADHAPGQGHQPAVLWEPLWGHTGC